MSCLLEPCWHTNLFDSFNTNGKPWFAAPLEQASTTRTGMKLRGSRHDENIDRNILRLRVGVQPEDTGCMHGCRYHEEGLDSLARRLPVKDMES